MTLTHAQRTALKAVYDRGPLIHTRAGLISPLAGDQPLTYRQFRRYIRYSTQYVMLHWQGMWLGIERDGYTHS